jgi:hypothetical protein
MSLAMPPAKADNLSASFVGNGNNRRIRISWADNSISETSFLLQRTVNGTTWVDIGTLDSPLNAPNLHGQRSLTDPTSNASTPYRYRVLAQNTVGYGGAFPSVTAKSTSSTLGVNAPQAPTLLTAALQTVSGAPRVSLTWRDNATNETGFLVERSTDNGVTFTQIAAPPARSSTGNVTFVDTAVTLGSTYQYRVAAVNAAGASGPTNVVTTTVAPPTAPANLAGTAVRQGGGERMTVTWNDVVSESGYTVQWSSTQAFTTTNGTGSTAANVTSFTTGSIARQVWYVRVRATNALGVSPWSGPIQVTAAP